MGGAAQTTIEARTAELQAAGVEAVILVTVDNAGITRVKAVPTAQLATAVDGRVGISPCFDTFGADDSSTTTPVSGGPVGDLRLRPDPDRLVALAGQPGFAWAPAERVDQHGRPHPLCQRHFARRMVTRAAAQGLEVRMGFETEFVLAEAAADDVVPATTAPAYSAGRLIETSDLVVDLLHALRQQGVPVAQLHPEYSPGQFEVSTAPADPVGAADEVLLVRHTIRAVAARHGRAVSFSPAVEVGGVGNGAHLHLSVARDGANLFGGGPGRHGLTVEGEAFAAGVLDLLPALLAIGAPSAASYLRLVPQRWSAPFQCWGLENREAAVRLVAGRAEADGAEANVEVKVFDATANPYLVVGAVIAAGLVGVDTGRRLPEEVTVDPATLDAAGRPPRLPTSLAAAADALATCTPLQEALGPALHETIVAVRRAEADRFAEASEEEVVRAARWRH